MTNNRRRGPLRRRRPRRIAYGRRRADVYGALGRFAGLIGFATTAILGQAELVGEPYRHWITVTAIGATAIWAYCMRPGSAKELIAMAKRQR